MPPSAPASPSTSDAVPVAVQFIRNPRARRYILRVGRNRVARVTIPRGGSEAFARRFVAEKAGWIQSQLERLAREPAPRTALPWRAGTRVWYRGEELALEPVADGCRLGDQVIRLRQPEADWRPAVERHLRRLAEREFPPQVREAAARYGTPIQRVSIRNQRTRWGSCSRRGTISINWRLIQTPLLVRDYLFAHELAHVREMNHSRRFWRLVDTLYPAWREAEAWLKSHGRAILG